MTCPHCNGLGFISFMRDGYAFSRLCECRKPKKRITKAEAWREIRALPIDRKTQGAGGGV